jgi:hypothetical protein
MSDQSPTASPADAPAQLTRPARVLIGWMDSDQAALTIAGRNMERANNPEIIEKAKALRAAAAARVAAEEQTNILEEPPAALSAYSQQFSASPAAAPYFAEGWAIKVADLARVIAIQPSIFIDHASERAEKANEQEIESIARVTLPLPQLASLPIQFDEARNIWIIASRNPNLKIVGHFSTPLQPGLNGFGFAVSVMQSFAQVVLYRGRLLLRDGNHRSLGLLMRGIRKAPVLYKEFGQFDDLGLGPGLLPPAAYLGDRPPTLADYLSDDVAAEVQLPATQKMVMIHAIEVTPIG